MNASVWVKESPGVDIVPDWLFWLILWWAAWFAAFLTWYTKLNRGPIPALVLFFIAVLGGVLPILIIIGQIVKRLRGDK